LKRPAERWSPRLKIAILSPHLDDAALSLGAYIRRQTRLGARVTAVTVLGNDPTRGITPAGPWDARCGFDSAAAAARARRAEDLRACQLLGATPIWLPYPDETYRIDGRRLDDEALWADLVWAIGDADAVLAPGFPLCLEDHRLVTRLFLERFDQLGCAVGIYAEQPYAAGRLLRPQESSSSPAAMARHVGRVVAGLLAARPPISPSIAIDGREISGLRWQRVRASRDDRRAKLRAVMSYRSQIRALGVKPMLGAWFYEAACRGESVAWLSTPLAGRSGGP
jgi:LmbE family N-acetylglucosaminyl deacetylase